MVYDPSKRLSAKSVSILTILDKSTLPSHEVTLTAHSRVLMILICIQAIGGVQVIYVSAMSLCACRVLIVNEKMG